MSFWWKIEPKKEENGDKNIGKFNLFI